MISPRSNRSKLNTDERILRECQILSVMSFGGIMIRYIKKSDYLLDYD